MPTPNLSVTVREATAAIARLENFRADSRTLSAMHQHLIAELLMLRLFAILEFSIENLACKLVAGATYLNGDPPNRLVLARSLQAARSAMETHDRINGKITLRWTSSRDIRKSTSTVLCGTDPFLNNTSRHAHILTEMRKVRNYLAHKSASSRKGYREVLRSIYGANRLVRVESFLTSPRRHSPTKIDQYLASTRVIISDLAMG